MKTFEFLVQIEEGVSQLVAFDAVDEAEARSRMAESFPGYAFVLNDPDAS